MLGLQRRAGAWARWRFRRRRRVWLGGLLATIVLAALGLTVVPAIASPTDDIAEQCRAHANGSLSFDVPEISMGRSVTATWRAYLPSQCYTLGRPGVLALHGHDLGNGDELLLPPIYLSGGGGSLTMPLPSTGRWSLEYTNYNRYGDPFTAVLGAATVTVDQPLPLDDPHVNITASGTAEREKFVRAMATPNAVVRVDGNVDLDLTGVGNIPVAPGVQLIGDRTVNSKGPRLFTTTFANAIFVISAYSPGGADGVRISGLRLDGGEGDEAHPYAGLGFDEDAIQINSAQHVEIDHNEIYHWHGAAVHVSDGLHADGQPGRINRDNADTVRVHDNFIHDNQHPTASDFDLSNGHGSGYGVELSDGAYATVERNAFNNNRHAITAANDDGTGYLVYGNLFMHPGIDRFKLGFTSYNHQIDVHGRYKCGIGESYNCGPAGEYMDVRYNTVTNDESDAIQLRGLPTIYMDVRDNVFAQSYSHALTETVGGGIHDGGNRYFAAGLFNDTSKSCDFDGDGVADSFRATGATWWYLSSRLGYFVYLNTDSSANPDITLADENGDNRCDVRAHGQVFLNTDPILYVRPQGNLTSKVNDTVGLSLIAAGATPPYRWTATSLPPGVSISTAGRISGRISGPGVFRVIATVLDAGLKVRTVTFQWTVNIGVPNLIGLDKTTAEQRITNVGLSVGVEKDNNDCASPGDVEVQHPAAGTGVPAGSAVDLTRSTCTQTNPGGGGAGDDGGPILPK